ncbi:tRNA lysidine(34) synthetase TilS [Brumimicrobium oceani]|uniref:tRNA(Ile)-lysidine synthase n=1 Tax=Brumimicrobium oceani TaxID=2100725 RepID=A0A2U2XGD5_9FLAO|nr:tRNA lysidine(34) synthetase TilS [Brumimicrobium oceani]PWH86854.1 tRNA lysidine(34) synthetase TilS [Brumimicrobium oceani]
MTKAPKYWVACSGGVDSVVLLYLMHEEKKDVGILHCNFQLRDESSQGDEAFVRELAEKLELPIRVKVFDTKKYGKKQKINTQLAARELRYNWFDEVIEKEGGIILLGHHYDDQVETFFLQLRRGGKVRSLAGMPVYRKGYLRPILKYSKADLIELANKQAWHWREDISNASNDYTRNWYRNEILPLLNSKAFPMESVVPLVNNFQQIFEFLKTLPIPNSILISDWIRLTIWEKQHVLVEQNMGEYSTSEIDKLIIAEKGKFIGNTQMKLWNEGNELVFVAQNEIKSQFELNSSVLPIDEVELNQKDLFLDAFKLKGGLSFRNWKSGDRFQPLGMKGEKSVGKFLRDRKVAAHQKAKIQVLVNENNEVIGVFGFGVSETVRIDSETKNVKHIQLSEI